MVTEQLSVFLVMQNTNLLVADRLHAMMAHGMAIYHNV